jgi:hypothetical protein
VTTPADSACPVTHHRWRPIFLIIVLVAIGVVGLLLALRACHEGPARCTTCPASSLPAPKKCAKSGVANDMPTNDMPTNDMPTNGLSAVSLETNRDLLQQLAAAPLAEDLFTSPVAGPHPLRDALMKDHAADLVQYIASCALDPCEHVGIPDGDEFAHLRRRFPDGFPGGLGLCSSKYNAWAGEHNVTVAPGDSWRSHKASEECLQRVSSCVIARVNAVEARVPISMRGDGMKLLDKVEVQTKYRENHGTPIQSFKGCDRMCLWGDPERRNCDWEPRYVGQCVRGLPGEPARTVKLALAPGAGARVRICKGIYGCDDTDPAPGAGAATEPVFAHGKLVEFPMHYGGQRIEHQRTGNAIEFECPDNGPLVSAPLVRTGYYSVMVGSAVPGAPLAAGTDVTLVGSASTYDRYPAPEAQIFTYREGGFYGSLFSSPERPTERRPVCPSAPAGDQYACASEIWKPVIAQSAARLCAGPPGLLLSRGCFSNTPGMCDVPAGAPLCSREPGAGPAIYDACTGGTSAAPSWQRPYTVYLNHPCDLFATDEECKPALTPEIAEYMAVRARPSVRPVRPGGPVRPKSKQAP